MTTPKGQTVNKEIEFKLTMKEIAEKGQRAADLDGEIDKLDFDRKCANAEAQQKINERADERRKISACIRDRKELRMVEAKMVKNFEGNVVQFYVEVDGKWTLAEERAMDAEERQLELGDTVTAPKNERPAKTAKDGRRGDADKAERSKKRPKAEQLSEIEEHIREETGRKSKRSAVDGPRA